MLCSSCELLPADIPDAPQKHAPAVVFDIDGTLTPRPIEVWEARDNATKAVQLFVDKGYKIIYLSARTKLFQANIPSWLKKEGLLMAVSMCQKRLKMKRMLLTSRHAYCANSKRMGGKLNLHLATQLQISMPMPQSESRRSMSSRFNAKEKLHAKRVPGRHA